MKLIIDNGGTNARWIALDAGINPQTVTTKGIHPFFTSDDEIKERVFQARKKLGKKIHEIFFYSTGCGSTIARNRLSNLFYDLFDQPEQIEIDSDILAAAQATCQKKAGICCIVGTGSNACLYDGSKIVNNRGGQGFILGDEGSGASLGKALIAAFLNDILPQDLNQKLLEQFNVNRDQILDAVYQKNHPNRYLASFAPFLAENQSHSFIQKLLKDQFDLFFQMTVTQFQNFQKLPLFFVGSVAFNFQNIIVSIANQYRASNPVFHLDPIQGLIKFHTQNPASSSSIKSNIS